MKIKKPLLLLVPGIIIIAAFTIFFTISQFNKSEKDTASSVKEHNASAENTPLPSGSPSGTSSSKPESTITNISANYTNKWGNTPSNILNGGYFASSGDYLYFDSPFNDSSLFPGMVRSMKDGITGLVRLPVGKAHSINVLGDWIYFIDSNMNLCKTRINGKDFTRIQSGPVTSAIVYDDSIYYICNDTLMKMPLMGSTGVILKQGVVFFTLSESGQDIIYIDSISAEDKFVLHKMTLSNTNDIKTFQIPMKNFCNLFFSYKNYIYLPYYSEVSQSSSTTSTPTLKILRLNTSSNNENLENFAELKSDVLSINFDDKYMYNTSVSGNVLEIVRTDLENKSKQSFIPSLQSAGTIHFCNIINDTAYFWSNINKNTELYNYDLNTKVLKMNILNYGF